MTNPAVEITKRVAERQETPLQKHRILMSGLPRHLAPKITIFDSIKWRLAGGKVEPWRFVCPVTGNPSIDPPYK